MARSKSYKKPKVDELSDVDFIKKKSTMYRSEWLARARKFGIDTNTVPTPGEIRVFLNSQLPWRCYLSGSEIPRSVVELDHKNSIDRGGNLSLDNVGVTSRFYNNSKGNMIESEFRELLYVINKWDDKGNSLLRRLISSNNIYNRKKYVR